jgi:tRNA G18 (ribose-2'-O)-methylase SpoU
MPAVLLLDASFPLFDLLQSACMVMLVSPALTSRLRHLLEIFVLNAFASHLSTHASASTGGSVDAVRDIERVLLPYLDRTLFRQNITCSFLVITGFLASWVAAERFRLECTARDTLASSPSSSSSSYALECTISSYTRLLHGLFSKLHVLVASPLGQVRTIAQYFFFALFVESFHADLFFSSSSTSSDDDGTTASSSILPRGFELKPGLTAPPGPGVRLDKEPVPLSAMSSSSRSGALVHTYFPMWMFLHRASGVASVRARQDEFFRAFRPFERASVEGLLRYAKEYRFDQRKAMTNSSGMATNEQDDDEAAAEDAESEEATQLPDLSIADGYSAAADANVSLSWIGSSLSNQDLLLEIRRITSAHLHSMTEERESSYFDDNNRAPVLHSAQPATAGTFGTHAAPASAAPDNAPPEVRAPLLNFQQKIAPAREQFLEDAEADSLGASAAAAATGTEDATVAIPRLPSDRHLIICASLVSKPVNLGGLCRTAEIMRCTLLLSDARLLSDATFVGTSSTANRWADIGIVAAGRELEQYLTRMRDEQGYAIVGLEQTVHSKPLQRVQFPPRVVLVLGDEKRGIPAPILSLLTMCVEIPQMGRIRSLNVHASGAMLVWEWIKQALNEQEAARLPGASRSGGRLH